MEEDWRRLFGWDIGSPKLIVDLAGSTATEGSLGFVALQGPLKLGKDLILYAGDRHCCSILGMGGSVMVGARESAGIWRMFGQRNSNFPTQLKGFIYIFTSYLPPFSSIDSTLAQGNSRLRAHLQSEQVRLQQAANIDMQLSDVGQLQFSTFTARGQDIHLLGNPSIAYIIGIKFATQY